MKTTLTHIIALVLVLALAGYAVWQAAERHTACRRAQQVRHEVDALRAGLHTTERQVLELRMQLAALCATNLPHASPEGQAVRSYLEGYAALMRTPEMQTTLRTQLDDQHVNIVYGAWLDGVALSARELRALRALLVDRAMAEAEAHFLLMRPGVDAECRARIREGVAPAQAAIDARIKAMLTTEDIARFDQCTAMADARIWVVSFNRHLERTQRTQLTNVQQDHAMRVMQQAFERLKQVPDYVDLETLAPEELTPEIAARYLAQQREMFTSIQSGLAAFLPAQQTRAFEEFASQAIKSGEARLQLTTRALQP